MQPSIPRADNYRHILSHLEDEIDETTNEMLQLDRTWRRWQVLLMLYSSIVWLAYVGYCVSVLRGGRWDTLVLGAAPAVVGPLCIYYARKLVQWWFVQQQTRAQEMLAWLRTRYSSKLDEWRANNPLLELHKSSLRLGQHALICRFCFAPNGLADDPEHTEYICPRCLKFNSTTPPTQTGTRSSSSSSSSKDSIASRVKRRRQSRQHQRRP